MLSIFGKLVNLFLLNSNFETPSKKSYIFGINSYNGYFLWSVKSSLITLLAPSIQLFV